MADRPASVSESQTHCKGVCFHILPNFVLEMFCFTWWEEEEEGLGSGEGWGGIIGVAASGTRDSIN